MGIIFAGHVFDKTGNYEQLRTTSLWLAIAAAVLATLIPKNAAKLRPT